MQPRRVFALQPQNSSNERKAVLPPQADHARYSLLILLITISFLAVFFAPVPNNVVRGLEIKWLRQVPSQVIVIGNSVVDHFSPCDNDRRTIAEMLSAAMGRPVLNMSHSGQRMDESIGFIAQNLLSPTGPIVFFASSFAFNDYFSQDVRTQLFFRLAAGKLHTTSLFERLAAGFYINPAIQIEMLPYSYKGHDYPDYEGVKTKYFDREHGLMECPEKLGNDRTFIEANYWNIYLRGPLRSTNVDDLVTVSRSYADKGRQLLVVLLPIDAEDLEAIDPDLAMRIKQRAADISGALRSKGVALLDLSSAEPSDRFSDRWWGVGHMGQAGRLDVAARVAAELTLRGK